MFRRSGTAPLAGSGDGHRFGMLMAIGSIVVAFLWYLVLVGL